MSGCSVQGCHMIQFSFNAMLKLYVRREKMHSKNLLLNNEQAADVQFPSPNSDCLIDVGDLVCLL